MSATSIVAAGRAAYLRLMVDTCTIARGTTGTAYDAATDTYAATPGATVYTGPCQVKARDNADNPVEAAGETVVLWPYIVTVPMTATGIELDDTVTVAAANADPALVGMVLRVKDVPAGSLLVARHLGCERSS